MSKTDKSVTTFSDLDLPASLMKALDDVGYETPSPIQAQTIPHLMKGLDLLGNAPTGTGKTAAFALPLLSRLDLKVQQVQVMVLTPTRELAIQVAEAFQRYASHIKDFRVLPIYGGQEYSGQMRQLKRGVHVVVGTPGRVMDHLRRGTLKLDKLQALVLDEADEMLRMGFHEDVEWILEQIPQQRQMALFSATMPKQIRSIAQRYLRDPREISIDSHTTAADTIRQRYWLVSNLHKLDALTRILEVETFDAMIVFVRTKIATTELADRLGARGYAASALNGDMAQKDRERTIEGLKKGKLDILVATDVAARGLDVERVSHVFNYDIPYDTEAYVHRIGRTGRAGRTGDAILFVAPREKRLLASIEKATRQKIAPLELPTTEMVNNKRIANFKQQISDTLAAGELEFMQGILEQYQQEHDIPALEVAAALAKMSMGDRSLLLEEKVVREKTRKRKSETSPVERSTSSRRRKSSESGDRTRKSSSSKSKPPEGMERFRIEVGHDHEVQPGNIVGAIANEAGLDAEHIGHIDIHTEFTFIDLPSGMPREVFRDLKKTWVCGRRINISRVDKSEKKFTKPAGEKGKKKKSKKSKVPKQTKRRTTSHDQGLKDSVNKESAE